MRAIAIRLLAALSLALLTQSTLLAQQILTIAEVTDNGTPFESYITPIPKCIGGVGRYRFFVQAPLGVDPECYNQPISITVNQGWVSGGPWSDQEFTVTWFENVNSDGTISAEIPSQCPGEPNATASVTVELNHRAPAFTHTANQFVGREVVLPFSAATHFTHSTASMPSSCGTWATSHNVTTTLGTQMHYYRLCQVGPPSDCVPPPTTNQTSGTLELRGAALPTIAKLSGELNLGSGAVLGVQQSYSGFSVTYTWFRDGQVMAGQTAATCTTTVAGEYQLRVTIAGGSLLPPQIAESNLLRVHPVLRLSKTAELGTGLNYTVENSFLKPIATLTGIAELPADAVAQAITFVDGLGRPVQSNQVRASPGYNDIVSFQDYPATSTTATQHLPYPLIGTTQYGGALRAQPAQEQTNFYSSPSAGVTANSVPRAVSELDQSPLDRVLKQGAAAPGWQPNQTGAMSERVLSYAGGLNIPITSWDYSTNAPVFGPGSYSAGALVVIERTNGQGALTLVYRNLRGDVVLQSERIDATANTWAHTLTIHDDFGRSRVVVPPEGVARVWATGGFTSTNAELAVVLTHAAFHYRYDDQGQLIEKKVPAKGWEQLIYDRAGRVVATQVPTQVQTAPTPHRYGILKYDATGRGVLTGELSTADTPEQLRTLLASSSLPLHENRATGQLNHLGYTNQAWPTSGYVAEAITYYDDYDLDRDLRTSSPDARAYRGLPQGGLDSSRVWVPGLTVAVRWRMLGAPATAPWATDTTLYDGRGRVIQQVDGGFGFPSQSFRLDWAGRVHELRRHVRVSNSWTGHSSTALVEQHSEQFEHDHRGRLWRVRTGGVVLAEHRYNELGQRSETNYYSTDTRDYRQSVDFAYHPMGWLQRVNRIDGSEAGRVGTSADFFALELGYETADPAPLPGGFAAPTRHDGRISWLRWRDPNSGPGIIGWHFRYDGLGRLLDARSVRHAVGAGGALINPTEADHTREQASYDREGNLLSLVRHHQNVLIDQLSYRYAQGRLENVRDVATARLAGNADFADGTYTNTTAVEFSYDVAGNVLLDQNRNFAAEYNRLNRVTRLVGPGGTNAHESHFAYDGLGRLRFERTFLPVTNPQPGQQRIERERHFAQGLTLRADYNYGFNTQTQEWAVLSSSIVTDRVDGSAGYWSSGKWHFSITDQVGTPRVIFNQDGQVVERNHTYPYGLRHATWSSTPTGTPEEEGYAGGQRVANELAVTWQRNGARMYDAALGRFLGVEPLADRYANVAGYLYALGNPVSLRDPSGFAPEPRFGDDWDSHMWWATNRHVNMAWGLVDYANSGNADFSAAFAPSFGGGRWVIETTYYGPDLDVNFDPRSLPGYFRAEKVGDPGNEGFLFYTRRWEPNPHSSRIERRNPMANATSVLPGGGPPPFEPPYPGPWAPGTWESAMNGMARVWYDFTTNPSNDLILFGLGTELRAAGAAIRITISKAAFRHYLLRHSPKQVAEFVGKSKFFSNANFSRLIHHAERVAPVASPDGSLIRVVKAPFFVGIDRKTNYATQVYTVVTDKAHNFITMFPGTP